MQTSLKMLNHIQKSKVQGSPLVVFHVLFLQTGTHGPLQSKEQNAVKTNLHTHTHTVNRIAWRGEISKKIILKDVSVFDDLTFQGTWSVLGLDDCKQQTPCFSRRTKRLANFWSYLIHVHNFRQFRSLHLRSIIYN